MEQIGHLQWTIGIFLIIVSVLNIPITGWDILILGLVTPLPDILDLLWGKQNFNLRHRFITHSLFFVLFWFIIAWLYTYRIFFLIGLGILFHIIEDIIAGGVHINIFSPFSGPKIMIISKGTQKKIGKLVKKYFSAYFLGTESLSENLAYYWLITMVGSWLFILGLTFYLFV